MLSYEAAFNLNEYFWTNEFFAVIDVIYFPLKRILIPTITYGVKYSAI
jgi:hypothetical protein